MFLNRRSELAFLQEECSRGGALVVIYGRRRVGKTELLRHFARDQRTVFHVAVQTSAQEHLRGLATELKAVLPGAAGVAFADWEGVFAFLVAQASEPLLVVLDEFPYLVESEPALPSIIQRAWDQSLRHSQVRMVLCGSSVALMERSSLAQKSPLYGRRTAQFLVGPLEYREAAEFFPGLTRSQQLEHFAVLGGIPAYLLQFDPDRDLWANVRSRILRKGAFLRDEPTFLLMQELREARLYMAVLSAIAAGRSRLGEIAERALGSAESHRVSFYLDTLQQLHLVERVVPLTEESPHKSRRGLYRLADPFVRFWFRYVHPERSRLELGLEDAVLAERIQPDFAHFCAPIFEEVCRRFVARAPLPFSPAQVGAWWSAAGEVDVVAWDLDRRNLLVGECKWSTRPVGNSVLSGLEAGAQGLVAQFPGARVHRALFSRSGFTPAVDRRQDLLTFDLEDLYAT